jgi:hypothetical protein
LPDNPENSHLSRHACLDKCEFSGLSGKLALISENGAVIKANVP